MLQTWTMPAPKLEGIGERGGSPVEITSNPTAFLDEAGYTSIVATNSEFEINRYPKLGDVISATSVYEDGLRREDHGAGHRVLPDLGAHLHRPER